MSGDALALEIGFSQLPEIMLLGQAVVLVSVKRADHERRKAYLKAMV